MKEKIIHGEENIAIKCYKEHGVCITKGNPKISYTSFQFWCTYEEWDAIVKAVAEARREA